MTFTDLAKSRYSERYFDSRPVEQKKIDKILEAGRTSPTACNYQPQRIYVIQSEEALKRARSIRVSHFNAPLMMLVCYDTETAWRNPHDRWYDNYCSGEQDAAIVAATMMYQAEELGVDGKRIDNCCGTAGDSAIIVISQFLNFDERHCSPPGTRL